MTYTTTHLLSAPYHHSPNVVRADFPDGQYILCGVPGGRPRLVMSGGSNVGTLVTWAPACDSLADFRREVVDVWNGYGAYVDSLPEGQPQLMISQWRDSGEGSHNVMLWASIALLIAAIESPQLECFLTHGPTDRA